ncbi:RFX-type winged-helix domain-containing protein [Mycena kentingensis (nom. inval.)]|nr:RFX-type winged-helix domain-containing protein [Mycena kentingensis (nom. inval.)]
MQTPIASASAFRPAQLQQYAAAPRLQVDGHERWYTDQLPNNRMTLALRSGITSEVHWALERLLRLSYGEVFYFEKTPGVADALFEWPEWYINEGYKASKDEDNLFSPSREFEMKRRHALDSLSILRNAASFENNARELIYHPHSMPLVCHALSRLDPVVDDHAEFLLNVVEFFHCWAAWFAVSPAIVSMVWNPIPPLCRIAQTSQNRSLIISSLTTLTVLFHNPHNMPLLSPNSPALDAVIRYLPLCQDKQLLEACLEFLFAHLSHPAMAKEFLLHPKMPAVLKLLVSVLLNEQVSTSSEQEISQPVRSIPTSEVTVRDYELTKEDLESLVKKPEPQRCYDWLKLMFAARPEHETPQVQFWTNYREAFQAHAAEQPLLNAADVIKNVSVVFPSSEPVGLDKKYIVRGVDRRKVSTEAITCRWKRSKCGGTVYETLGQLFDHLLEHLAEVEGTETACLWADCTQTKIPKTALRQHLLTHLPPAQPPQRPASQSDTISVAAESNDVYPMKDPTTRIPPPVRTTLTIRTPTGNPPSTSLTALLCIRILFRTSFTSMEAAPRADEDRFGFPWLPEGGDEVVLADDMPVDKEKEGEMRGRKAFSGVQRMMEEVQLEDEILQGWIIEMVVDLLVAPGNNLESVPYAQLVGDPWLVVASTLPLWKNRKNVRITYSPIPHEPETTFDDLVEYNDRTAKPGSAPSTVKGIDRLKAGATGQWKWRGKGLLMIASSHWQLLGLNANASDAEPQWAVTYFASTLFTPAGLDIYARSKEALTDEFVEGLVKELEGIPAVKKLVENGGMFRIPHD